MMVLEKYMSKMSLPRMVHCCTILELMRRGYKYEDAKRLLKESNLLQMASSSDEGDRRFVMHYDDEAWADMCDPRVAV